MGEKKKMKKVLLDTNFLIDLGRFGISIDEIDRVLNERYELFVTSSVMNELKTIAGMQQEEGKFAKLALMILDLRKAKIIQTEKIADEAIMEIVGSEKDTIVATDDIELKKRVKAIGGRVVSIRAKKKLEIG